MQRSSALSYAGSIGFILFGLIGRQAAAQTCTVSATGIAFGVYDPQAMASATSTATVTVTCNSTISLLVSYSIQLGPGSGGSYAARSMSGSGGRLPYQLYTSSLYSQVWGDGTAGTISVTDGYLLGVLTPVVNNYTAYGRVTASANVGVGSYGDSITVLIIY